MPNYQELSMLDTAISILENNNGKMNIHDLTQKTLEAKGIEDKDNEYKTQLYLDITTSARFVYMGEEEWDLKDRQPLAMYDKDGSEFNTAEDLDLDKEEDNILTFDDDEEKEEDEDYDDYEDEDEDDEEEDEDDDLERDDNGDILERYHEDDSDDFDEDKYNDYMDDFEDMYDDN